MKTKSAASSSNTQFAPHGRALWGVLFLLWLALGVFSAAWPLLELPPLRRRGPRPTDFWRLAWITFLSPLLNWLLWAALTPITLRLRKGFPLESRMLWRSLPVHLLAVALLCGIHSVASLFSRWLVLDAWNGTFAPLEPNELLYWWLRDLPFCTLFYGLVLGIGSALDYYRQFRERELRASQLEAQLAQAQLEMLKMQLHPHFLFNTLNGITGLVRDHENAAAVQMLVGLSELLRQTLDSAGKQEVRLQEELEWLELYLKLQQMRFPDRLQVRLDAASDTLDVLVPNLITQPLVENAIRHGLAPRTAPGTISLTAQRNGTRLELSVCDDGLGLPDGWQLAGSQGVGLNNTVARLRQLYGTAFDFDVSNRTGGGVEAKLSLPLRQLAFVNDGQQ